MVVGDPTLSCVCKVSVADVGPSGMGWRSLARPSIAAAMRLTGRPPPAPGSDGHARYRGLERAVSGAPDLGRQP